MIEMRVLREKIKVFMLRSDSLYIQDMAPCYGRFFKDLGCYRNIKTLIFEKLKKSNISILEQFFNISTLNPQTLYIRILESQRLEELIDTGNFMLPQSINHINLDCSLDDYESFIKILKNTKKEQKYESLTTTFDMRLIRKREDVIEKLLNQFESVVLMLRDFTFNYRDLYFKRLFSHFTFLSNPNVEVHFELYVRDKSTIRQNRNSALEIDLNHSENEDIETRGLPTVTKVHIANLQVFSHPFRTYELNLLTSDLGLMKNIKTLIIDFRMFIDIESFKDIIKSLNDNIENIKIKSALTITVSHFKIMAQYCKNIKNLIIINLNPSLVPIEDLFTIFPNLDGLKAFYFNKDMIKQISNYLRDGETYKLKWPSLKFVHISCNNLSIEEYSNFRLINKRTPRKCGKLLINTFIDEKKLVKLDLIIQKNVNCLSNFEAIFNTYRSTFWMTSVGYNYWYANNSYLEGR
uniref:FTH domain-containing protein n=1 Tax=Parastrongyloides trichosuri TaxID=131310 RepID=A0A0N4ZFM5_PARTI